MNPGVLREVLPAMLVVVLVNVTPAIVAMATIPAPNGFGDQKVLGPRHSLRHLLDAVRNLTIFIKLISSC